MVLYIGVQYSAMMNKSPNWNWAFKLHEWAWKVLVNPQIAMLADAAT